MDILMTVIIHRLCAIHKAPFLLVAPVLRQMPWLMDELAVYCFHCLLGDASKWLRVSLQQQRRQPVERFEQRSTVNNNLVGVVYNSITTTRWQRKRQRPTVTGDISMESHSQYLVSPLLPFIFSLHASTVCLHSLFIITILTQKQTKEKKVDLYWGIDLVNLIKF